jgi:hypothetical protein
VFESVLVIAFPEAFVFPLIPAEAMEVHVKFVLATVEDKLIPTAELEQTESLLAKVEEAMGIGFTVIVYVACPPGHPPAVVVALTKIVTSIGVFPFCDKLNDGSEDEVPLDGVAPTIPAGAFTVQLQATFCVKLLIVTATELFPLQIV